MIELFIGFIVGFLLSAVYAVVSLTNMKPNELQEFQLLLQAIEDE